MARKTKVESIYAAHYRDLLNLNRAFIQSLNRPRLPISDSLENTSRRPKKLTKKQLEALAKGRKKLAKKRAQKLQV